MSAAPVDAPFYRAFLIALCLLAASPGAAQEPLPRAEPNDQRTPAGRMVGGELHVELEAMETEWYPRGPEGPGIVVPAFAEAGGSPQVPGPLIRVSAGTPVRVRVRNRLDRTVTLRGLLDRATMRIGDRPEDAVPEDPDFFFSDSLVVPPGEVREVRFTPTAEVSSFYYGRRAAPQGGLMNTTFLPGNFGDEGVFLGGMVVDPAGAEPPPEERLMIITRWGGPEEPSTLGVTFKMMINGLSWPFTERLSYAVGDTVHWRLINASAIAHPMHLHGFYFTVDARGDTDTDTVYAPASRQSVVTDVMPDFSSLRLTWVPEEPGNWIFHCHLIRHMGAMQRFSAEGEPRHPPPDARMDPMAMEGMVGMDGMAGLVMGLTVAAADRAALEDPAPERTIHLWTSRTPGALGEHPALSFVATEGREPPLDTLLVPGSPLVLEQHQPTEIIVHNRLDVPLSVHWHGLEVRSRHDGVAYWSGRPGATRPPVASGEMVRVSIAPPRAGTFIYHVHGELGYELTQGLYGPFLVLPRGETLDPDSDRVFVLSARGAGRDAPPVINGEPDPAPERFRPGRPYRLRFIHISPDASKRVRLLKDGEPILWDPLAKDGADLPAAARMSRPAAVEVGVGETYDFTWTPEETGVYVLEVETIHYSASGLPATLQRVAFGVGDVTDAALTGAFDVATPPASLAGRPFPRNDDPQTLPFSVLDTGCPTQPQSCCREPHRSSTGRQQS